MPQCRILLQRRELARSVINQEDLHQQRRTGKQRVTLGQFSMVRLERDSQLLIPMYDYCMPTRECAGGDEDGDEDPCEIFRQIRFPVGEFFPPSTLPGMEEEEHGGASCSHNSCC